MGFVLTAVGGLGVLALAVAWTMAAFVLANAAGRASNRALALFLFLEGAGAGTGNGLMFLTDQVAEAYAIQVVSTCIYVVLPAAYLLFLATTDSPLARPLRSRLARVLLAAYSIAGVALVLTRTDLFVLRMVQPWYAPWDQDVGPAFVAALGVGGLAGLYALAVSISLLRRSLPGGVARSRARAFIAAFATRDAAFVASVAGLPMAGALFPGSKYAEVGFLYAITASTYLLVYLPVLAYGILKAQLFDIDLRIKLGLRRGTVAATFLAVFFIVAQVAQNYFSSTMGYIAGGIAAGLLLFVLAPLQRAVERLADHAMPTVTGSPDYLVYRKHEIYRQALRDAAGDGRVTDRERAILMGLQKSLGIDPAVAHDMERDVLPA